MSVLSQTNYSELQVIIINDGCDENIYNIVQDYKNKGLNIEYYWKKNANWGSVVNYCVKYKLIKAKYFTILDSDDTWSLNCIDYFKLGFFQNADIILGNFFFCESLTMTPLFICKIYDNRLNGFYRVNNTNIDRFVTKHVQPIGKFYRSSLLKNFKKLKESVHYMDTILYYNLLRKCSSIFVSTKIMGYYRSLRPNSSNVLPWDQNRVNEWLYVVKFYGNNISVELGAFFMQCNDFKIQYKKFYNKPVKFSIKSSRLIVKKYSQSAKRQMRLYVSQNIDVLQIKGLDNCG